MVKITNGISEREVRAERLPLFLRLGYWMAPQPEPEARPEENADEETKNSKN